MRNYLKEVVSRNKAKTVPTEECCMLLEQFEYVIICKKQFILQLFSDAHDCF